MAKGQTSKQADQQAVQEAEERVREAQAALQEAAQAAAEAGQGLAVTRTRAVPDMAVEVMPGHTISHDGKTYFGEGYTFAPDDHKGNDELTLPGPTALALMQQGAVRIKGTT